MSRKGQSLTLSVSDRDKAELEALALEFGMKWGDRSNISKLVEAIARRQLQIALNHDWSQTRIEALEQARKALVDLGEISQAQEIARTLSERSELKIPSRAEIESFLNHSQPTWRQEIDRFIKQEQPFCLSYQDASDRLYRYTVLYAQIVLIEKRQYLVCRCEETNGNEDIPELCHNWTLRLDRITEAAVTAIEQPWEKDLERISVEFHLFGRLAFAYEGKPEDELVSELEGDPPVRRVVRSIFTTFWFFREIAPYWGECVVISPENVRSRLKNKLLSLVQNYDLERRD